MKSVLSLTLLATAAAMSFGIVSARATGYTLNDGSVNLASGNSTGIFAGDTFEVSSGTVSGSSDWGTDGHLGAWIGWDSAGVYSVALGTSTDKVTITGSGFFGIALKNGDASTATTVDLSYVDVSNFAGQLCVVNQWNDNVTVKLSGEQWAGVEYVFGSVTAEWAGVTTGGNGNWNNNDTSTNQTGKLGLFTRGTGDSDSNSIKEHDILELQGDTTLAGITGTSKDYSTNNGNVYANDDYITVTTAGTTLTLVGEGDYEFYGTVGAEGLELSISMGYDSDSGNDTDGEVGSQTFGGTNYLYDVAVNEGTLKLGGTTSIAGSVTVAASSTLELGGEITLSNTIQNSGTVVIDSSTVFVLDNLTAIYDVSTSREYYELIISTDNESLSINDLDSLGFILGGETINWTAYETNGSLYIYSDALASKDLIWSGTSSANTWTTDSLVTDWTISNTTTSTSFSSGDSVTFGPNTSSFSNTIILGENITAGTVTITGSGYTLTASDTTNGNTLTATTIILDDEDSATEHTFTIAEGVTVKAESLTESAGQLDLVVNGSLEVTSMTVTNEQSESISGTGTLKVGSLTVSTLQGTSLTIAVSEATFESISIVNHSNYGTTGDNNSTDGYHSLIIGDGMNVTTATVTGNLEMTGGTGEVAVAAGSTLTVQGTLIDSSGYKTSISGDGKLIANAISITANNNNAVNISIADLQVGTFTIGRSSDSSDATVTISSAKFTADSLTYSSNGNLTISSAEAVIGSIESGTTHTLTIAESGNLTAGEIYRSGNTLNLVVNGTLTVDKLDAYEDSTGMIYFGKSTDNGTSMAQTLSGSGIANVYGIEANLGSGSLTISVSNLNIGEGGITRYGSGSGTVNINGTKVGLYNTNASTISADITIGTSGVTFNPGSGQTLTISGALSGSGSIEKTGEGTLILSAANSFSGGLTITSGTVVAENSSALGSSSGTVTIENGGTLEISSGVTISNNITIILSEANISTTDSASPTSVVVAYAGDTDVYALIGEGSIAEGVTITITVNEAIAALLAEGGCTYTFNIYDYSNLDLSGVTWDYHDLAQYGYEWNNDGTITLLPEPSTFGLLFGLSAVAFTATRRRRRKVA